jgi:hypothetical protein
MGSTGKFIDEGVKDTFPVFSHPTDASFIDGNNTVVPAEKTMNLAVRPFLVKGGFFHGQPPKLRKEFKPFESLESYP